MADQSNQIPNLWLECKGYVYRRHMLPKAKWTDDRLVANVCSDTEEFRCDDALKWLYDLLTALDSKASALMRLNGVMLAAAAFLLSIYSGGAVKTVLRFAKPDEIAIVLTAALSSVSIVLCLFVVNVSWYFLGRVSEAGGLLDYTHEFQSLQKTAARRQLVYRLAWKVSLLASILFVLEFLRQAVFVLAGWGA